MSSSERASVIVCLGALLALSACGFRLQGSQTFPEVMATTYIEAEDRYSEFYRGLRLALEQGGVAVTDSVVAATAVLRIEQDQTGRSVLTVSSRNVPTEYDVYYRITYSVWADGAEILPSRSLTKRQDFTFDSTQVLGKSREEEVLREAIAQDLVRQVAQQLARL
ncbi:MAG: hypothetical protein HKN56_00165 [Gammaproteobacteria bacterium]|nr:hypothetical protein [Gammaproteobacteria bacterium]NND53369.1 hypothetical protein [Gammaproteobacteria bacterium]